MYLLESSEIVKDTERQLLTEGLSDFSYGTYSAEIAKTKKIIISFNSDQQSPKPTKLL